MFRAKSAIKVLVASAIQPTVVHAPGASHRTRVYTQVYTPKYYFKANA